VGEERLGQFAGQLYLNLETYRRSGQAVATPLWFVELAETLYVRTPTVSAKVKRLRNNSRVRVAPCTLRGAPTGAWVEARARFAAPAEAERVNELLREKYGWQKALIDFGSRLRRRKSVVIAIEF
jgi:PPOX class probable F420-dependent enzyme